MKHGVIAFVFIGLALLIASCGETQSCAELTKEYRIQVDKLASEWDSANEIANSTPRMELTRPITNLQNIRNEYYRLIVPKCAKEAHTLLLDYMDAIIEGYAAYIAYKPDTTVNDHFTSAAKYFDSWTAAFSKLAVEPTP